MVTLAGGGGLPVDGDVPQERPFWAHFEPKDPVAKSPSWAQNSEKTGFEMGILISLSIDVCRSNHQYES